MDRFGAANRAGDDSCVWNQLFTTQLKSLVDSFS